MLNIIMIESLDKTDNCFTSVYLTYLVVHKAYEKHFKIHSAHNPLYN